MKNKTSYNSKKIVMIVSQTIHGGVETVVNKLLKGLIQEGYNTVLVRLRGKSLLQRLIYDIRMLRLFRDSDALIYLGSFSYLSKFFLKFPLKILFIHGFIHSELVNAFASYISSRNIINTLGTLFLINYSTFLNKSNIDFFICHSTTSCQANNIKSRYVLLPQFLFKEEIDLLNRLGHSYAKSLNRKRYVITTYYTGGSPRLLNINHIIMLVKNLNKYFEKRGITIELNVFGSTNPYTNLSLPYVKFKGFVPQDKFWRYLANSDLFYERCVDEELGFATLEAGGLGVPIAKITLPNYLKRMDLEKDSHAIIAENDKDLLKKLIYYFEDIDYLRKYFSKNFIEYLNVKRSWDNVKTGLLKVLSNM